MTEPDQIPATPARRPRRDAFDGKRKRAFLDALGKSGSLRDAARKAGVSHQTVYNHQASDKHFARQCELALDMAGTDVELHAWERGVIGVEEPILHRGEIVGYRRKRSDAVLRLLLQATKPKKYGRNPGFTRKRLTAMERKNIEREVRARLFADREARHQFNLESVERKLDAMDEQLGVERLEQGWTRDEAGEWVPPGYVRADGWAALAQPREKGEPRVVSV